MFASWAILLMCTVSDAPERHIGFVVDLAGDWSINGTAIMQGQGLPPGGLIRLTARPKSGTQASISIVLLNNKSIHLTCDAADSCEKGLELPSSLIRSPSGLERLTQAALTLFGQKPDRYAPMLARGSSKTEGVPVESVLKKEAGQIGIEPVLATIPSGRYLLEFFRIAADGVEGNTKADSIEVPWNREQPAAIPSGRIREGLYQLNLLAVPQSPTNHYRSTVWVLVVSAEEYSKEIARYREVQSAVEQWDPQIPLAVRKSFLRAWLETMAGTLK